MDQLLPGVYRLTGLTTGNVYLIAEDDGLTLIDTSLASSAGAILRQVAELGRSPGDLKRILITHAHPDHIGGLPAIKQATGACVLASAADRPEVEGRAPMPMASRQQPGLSRFLVPPSSTAPGTPVDQEIGEGDIVPHVLGGLHVLATPGHTPGHLAFWHPEHRLLFCGDAMMRLFNLRLPPPFVTTDIAENKRSIRRLLGLGADIVCFGHGRPLRRYAAPRLWVFARAKGIVH